MSCRRCCGWRWPPCRSPPRRSASSPPKARCGAGCVGCRDRRRLGAVSRTVAAADMAPDPRGTRGAAPRAGGGLGRRAGLVHPLVDSAAAVADASRRHRRAHRRGRADRGRVAPAGRWARARGAALRRRPRRGTGRACASCRPRSGPARALGHPGSHRDHHARQRRRDRRLGAPQRRPFADRRHCGLSHEAGARRDGQRDAWDDLYTRFR